MVSSSLVLFSLVVGLASAEDAYTIKIKKPAKGDVVKVENVENGDNQSVVTVGAKELSKEKGKEGKNEVYVETVLEKAEKADKPTSMKRKYEKARVTKKDKEETRVYEGKTVLIEKKGDKYRFQIEDGKELTGMDAEALDNEFNSKKNGPSEEEIFEKILLPGKPVKVGDTWKIDTTEMFKAMTKEAAAKDAKASGKLLEVYEKNGHKFGKMDIEIETPITDFGGDKMKVAKGSKLKMTLHIDACIDGSSRDGAVKAEMFMDIEGTFDAGGDMEAKMVMHAKNLMSAKGTEQAKK
jgi:hypothetical protein